MVLRSKTRRGDAGRGLRGDDHGSVLVLFAFAIIPVVLLAGAAIDYARAARAKAQLRIAVDAATLAAAAKINGSYEERQQAALGALQANLGDSPLESVAATVADFTSPDGKGLSVEAQGVLPTSLTRVVGISTMEVAVRSEALSGAGAPAEIALVLDNTGSMENDMPALKAAASNFVNMIFASASATVKMSVVPYVAAVNVGADFPLSALEQTGMSSHHAQFYRGRWVTGVQLWDGCNPAPGASSGTTSSSPPVSTDPGTPVGKDKMSLRRPGPDLDPSPFAERARRFARSLFGVSRAAADVTPNTIDPIIATPYTIVAPYATDGVSPYNNPGPPITVQVPDGYGVAQTCYLTNPVYISHFDLFNRMPGARWKGCVEARALPYDVTDDPPGALADTHFVPYFAPDERDMPIGSPQFANNYLADTHASWVGVAKPLGWSPFDGLSNIMKYDSVNVPSIVETPPSTKGPNFACPDPLLRLTSVKGDILAKINALNYWNGGGTITSEGLAWGWRTISPNAPFAQGAAYSNSTKKYIVLMTDGLNSLVDNRPSGWTDLLSEYTAYGFLGQASRMSDYPYTFSKAEAFLNSRMMLVCANAKAKGIEIFTILFRESDPSIAALLASCATSPSHALKANDAPALNIAFNNVAGKVNSLRLSR